MRYRLVIPIGGPPDYRPPVELSVAEFNADTDDIAIERSRKVSSTFTTVPSNEKSLILKEGSRIVCSI